MTIDDIYKIVQYCTAKNVQDGYISPDDFNLTINVAQNNYFDYLLGEYQKQQLGRPIPTVAFGQNQKIRQSLAPLIYGTVLSINSTTGIAAYPSDFEQVDAMWSLYGLYNIKFTEQDALSSRYRSKISPIARNPVYLIKHEGFQFYPETTGFAKMSYVRTPPGMRWAYTLDSNDLPVYDVFNSVQSVWSDLDIFNIIIRCLQMVGVNLQLGAVMQFASEIKNTGQ